MISLTDLLLGIRPARDPFAPERPEPPYGANANDGDRTIYHPRQPVPEVRAAKHLEPRIHTYSGLRVECLEHREWGVLTVREAARRVGVNPYKVAESVGSFAIYGHRFVKAGSAWPERKQRDGARVRCRETGEEYPSIRQAADAIGTGRTNVAEAVRTGGKVRGKGGKFYTFVRLTRGAGGRQGEAA